MQGIAFQIVDLVDIDRTAQHRLQDCNRFAALMVRVIETNRRVGQKRSNIGRSKLPVLLDRFGQFSTGNQSFGQGFVARYSGQSHIFDRVAEGPVPNVMQQSCDKKKLRLVFIDDLPQCLVA